jgi:hypothetical protein
MKHKTNSVAGAIEAAKGAAKPSIEPPALIRLNEKSLEFFNQLANQRSRESWSPADVFTLALLSRNYADIERERVELEKEGVVVLNERGTQIKNPRFGVLTDLHTQQAAMIRSLALNTGALRDKRDIANQDKAHAKAKQLRADVEQEGLLA